MTTIEQIQALTNAELLKVVSILGAKTHIEFVVNGHKTEKYENYLRKFNLCYKELFRRYEEDKRKWNYFHLFVKDIRTGYA
jgi:hypothetical protein